MATFRRYLKIQLMMFVFGCVGPIFLVLFFTTQPDPSMKWAFWAGLFITAADVLIALALTSAGGPDKTPADVRLSMAVAKRMQSNRGYAGDHTSHSSTSHDHLSHLTFSSGWGTSSNDYSSSSDYSSSTDSESSSSDSGSSSSSSD